MAELASMHKYDSYKETGINWIGRIPESWNIEKAKWLFLKADRKPQPDDEIVTCFRDGEVTLRKNRRTEGFTNALKEHGYQRICKGDLVIHAMDAFAGAIGVSDSDGKSTPVYAACIPRTQGEVNPYFYAYYMRDLALSGFIVSLAKGIRERSTDFRFNDFAELPLPFPSYLEQIAIANFLDKKTAQINEAVAIKEKQIELLKERKQIVIQQAVTQGLNPNVQMKDSGVDWIGIVPKHWSLPKLKLISEFVNDGTHGSYPRVEEGYRLLSVRNIVNNHFVFREDDSRVSYKHFKEISSKFKVSVGDIQLAIVGATLGKVAVVEHLPEDIVTQRSVSTIRIKESKCSNRFVAYFMRSEAFQSYLWNNAGFSAQPGVYLNTVQNAYIPLPSIEEQLKIVEYIEQELVTIEEAISLQFAQIEKLKEYKATLINSAVTGKMKVPES